MDDLLSNRLPGPHQPEPDAPGSQQRGGFAVAIAGSANRNVDASGQPRPVTLTSRWMSSPTACMINCTEPLYDEIKTLWTMWKRPPRTIAGPSGS